MSNSSTKLGHLFAEIMTGHDVSRLDEIKAPNYVNHNAFAEPGLEGSKKVLGAIIAGVPDLKVTAEDVFASEDGTRVVGRYRYERYAHGESPRLPRHGPALRDALDRYLAGRGRTLCRALG